MMKYSIFLASALSLSDSASASVVCTLRWEASLDGGQSWRGGLIGDVPQGQPSVHVRLIASFGGVTSSGVAPAYFHRATMDAVVRNVENGLTDTTSSVSLMRGGGLSEWPFGPQRQGNLIKIDMPQDLAAPGLGSRWLESFQSQDAIGFPPSTENPIVLLGYTLFLDGTPGQRDIFGVFRVRRPTETQPNVPDVLVGLPGIAQYAAPDDLTIVNTSIIVVPTPAGVMVGVVGILVATGFTRRRRRWAGGEADA